MTTSQLAAGVIRQQQNSVDPDVRALSPTDVAKLYLKNHMVQSTDANETARRAIDFWWFIQAENAKHKAQPDAGPVKGFWARAISFLKGARR